MTTESLPPAAVLKTALPATSGLDLERWPRWMRDALAIQPETTAPAYPRIENAPARTDPASVRKLTRMPSRF
jgi:hypothetical protein